MFMENTHFCFLLFFLPSPPFALPSLLHPPPLAHSLSPLIPSHIFLQLPSPSSSSSSSIPLGLHPPIPLVFLSSFRSRTTPQPHHSSTSILHSPGLEPGLHLSIDLLHRSTPADPAVRNPQDLQESSESSTPRPPGSINTPPPGP